MCIPAVAGLSQQTAPLLAPLVAQLCSLVMISHPKAPPTEVGRCLDGACQGQSQALPPRLAHGSAGGNESVPAPL